jgi:hypothetical protein
LISLHVLRKRFERAVVRKHFGIHRLKNGEYSNANTFLLWGGYWECAMRFDLLLECDRDDCGMHN